MSPTSTYGIVLAGALCRPVSTVLLQKKQFLFKAIKICQIKKLGNYKFSLLLTMYNFYLGCFFIGQSGSNFVHKTYFSKIVS
jgi:hypothetical protein